MFSISVHLLNSDPCHIQKFSDSDIQRRHPGFHGLLKAEPFDEHVVNSSKTKELVINFYSKGPQEFAQTNAILLFINSSVVATMLHPPSCQPTLDGGWGQRSCWLMIMEV